VNTLAIDTSTSVLALSARRGEMSASLALRHGLEHSPSLLPLIRRLMEEISLPASQLDLVVCSVGPGSFTGIRIGLAAAKGIAFAISRPLVGVSTLDALALPYARTAGAVYPVIDARKGRWYTAVFRSGARDGGYLDISPGEILSRLQDPEPALLVGPDADGLRDSLLAAADAALRERVSSSPFMDPRALLRLGEEKFLREGADPDGCTPIYLRKSEAEIAASAAKTGGVGMEARP
jgi:tRNA threonylcarbamoyladenosine biosynthesis protein TsaB